MSTKNTMKVATRLGIGFGLVLMLMLGVAGTAIVRLSTFNQNVHILADDRVPKILVANNWLFHLAETASHTRTMLILEDEALIKAEIDKVAKDRLIRTEALEQLKQTVNLPAGKLALQKVIDARDNYLPHETEFLKLIEAGDKGPAKTLLMQDLRPRQREYITALEKFIEFQISLVHTTRDETNAAYKLGLTLLISIATLAILVSLFAAWFITRKLVGQLGGEPDYAANLANRIADGDLSMEIELAANDNTSLLFSIKQMRDKLHQIVSDVRHGTDNINAASTEIAAGNQDLSSRTEQQAGSLEETASSMEELTSTVKQNADNARQAVTLAHSAAEVAGKGGMVVSQVVSTMGAINESAKKIVDIISVIDGIAFQTNILALNAAVEAARAGEQGRGFAVVASEVRNLAQRSASAAKEIKTLINDSVEKVDAGSRLVDQAGSTMHEVVTSVRLVTDMIGEITAASQEQTQGIEQINQAIMQMDDVTQQNAALVEQAAAAASSMQNQASKLAQVVSVFRLEAAQKTHTRIEKWSADLAQHKASMAKGKSFPATNARKLLRNG